MIKPQYTLRRNGRRLFSSSETFNKSEVDKFSAVGRNWWNRSSPAGTGPLHDMNPPRIDFIRKNLAMTKSTELLFDTDQIRGLRILDVGCGGGLLSESLARLGAIVTGIDPSAENIRIARMHSSLDPLTSDIQYRETTIEALVENGETFDAVCSLEVVEHVDSPRDFVASCVRCLEPGGSLFLSTMNRTRKAHLMTIVAAEHILGLVPTGTHDWSKYITPDELSAMVEAADSGCKVRRVNGIVLRPPTLRELVGASSCGSLAKNWALSDGDLDVNYILHAVKT